ncbi:MAG: manganese catalase family protein [Bacilli bacterium]
MEYQSTLPYPKIKVVKQNQLYAEILSSSYAGANSELSAIHLYIYQYLIEENSFSQYHEILKEIAKVEMHHLNMLGQIIMKLGKEPKFNSYDNMKITPWSTTNINYKTDLLTMLEIDIKGEQTAIKNYQKQIKQIDDIYIKDLLNRIILDEQIHLTIFEKLYQEFTSC